MSAEEVWADQGAGFGLQVDGFALKTVDPAQVFLQAGGAARKLRALPGSLGPMIKFHIGPDF